MNTRSLHGARAAPRALLVQALGLVLLGCGVGLAIGLRSSSSSTADAQAKINEVDVGLLPTEFGAFRALTGSPGNCILAYENPNGVLRLLEFRGNQLNPRLWKITRE